MRPTEIDDSVEQYIRTALWSSSDGDDDRSLGEGDSGSTDRNCRFMTIDDVSDETLAQAIEDCAASIPRIKPIAMHATTTRFGRIDSGCLATATVFHSRMMDGTTTQPNV